MIIILKARASEKERDHVIEVVRARGLDVNVSTGKERTVLGVIGDKRKLDGVAIEVLPGVEQVMHVSKPYKRVSRDFHPDSTCVVLGKGRKDARPAPIGAGRISVIAGPCSVESEAQIIETGKAVAAAGGHALRGGAYKPRTSPYSFQGHGVDGLKMLAAARAATGLSIVTEVMDPRDVEVVCEYADCLQIGARNMQNFSLLKEAGKSRTPVLIKRGMSATIEDLLLSAEYVLAGGNEDVILCERGIRTFETATRNTADLSAIPLTHEFSHLPIVFDPSHALGRNTHVGTMAKAGLAAGADGLMIEIHLDPEKAFSDGPQALRAEEFAALLGELRPLASLLGQKMA